MGMMSTDKPQYDAIVVGSGAAGGTLARELALRGRRQARRQQARVAPCARGLGGRRLRAQLFGQARCVGGEALAAAVAAQEDLREACSRRHAEALAVSLEELGQLGVARLGRAGAVLEHAFEQHGQHRRRANCVKLNQVLPGVAARRAEQVQLRRNGCVQYFLQLLLPV